MDDEQFKSEGSPSFSFLDGVDGEIAFFSALMRARPVGMHRHFHVLTMRNDIYRLTGRLISVGEIWDKLKTCYDLDLLESIVSSVVFARRASRLNICRKSTATTFQGRRIRQTPTHQHHHHPPRI